MTVNWMERGTGRRFESGDALRLKRWRETHEGEGPQNQHSTVQLAEVEVGGRLQATRAREASRVSDVLCDRPALCTDLPIREPTKLAIQAEGSEVASEMKAGEDGSKTRWVSGERRPG